MRRELEGPVERTVLDMPERGIDAGLALFLRLKTIGIPKPATKTSSYLVVCVRRDWKAGCELVGFQPFQSESVVSQSASTCPMPHVGRRHRLTRNHLTLRTRLEGPGWAESRPSYWLVAVARASQRGGGHELRHLQSKKGNRAEGLTETDRYLIYSRHNVNLAWPARVVGGSIPLGEMGNALESKPRAGFSATSLTPPGGQGALLCNGRHGGLEPGELKGQSDDTWGRGTG